MKTTTVNNIIDVEFMTSSNRKPRIQNEQDLLLIAKIKKDFETFNSTREPNEKKLLGFCIGFEYYGKIYCGCFPLDNVLKRVKRNNGVDKIVQPIGTKQVLELCNYICTSEELEAYKSRMRGTTARDNGTTFQKYLAKIGHQKAELTRSITEGGDMYENKEGLWEVKYMKLGTSQASARYRKK